VTKEIPLTQGKVALVDDEDYDFLMQWKWHANRGYAIRTEYTGPWRERDQKDIRMHRVIVNALPGEEVDHINKNRADNRRANLRKCTHHQNTMNSPARNWSSQYKGVTFAKRDGRWTARIGVNYRIIQLGTFQDEMAAAIAYDHAAIRYHGDFAVLNFSDHKNVCRECLKGEAK
jgi:HNH endonuclease